MNSIIKQIQELEDADLYSLSEAIDIELHRRSEMFDDTPESARKRAIQRDQSYRRRTGAAAPPVRAVGIGKNNRTRRAA